MNRILVTLLAGLVALPLAVAAQQTPPPVITPESADELALTYTLERHRRAVTALVFTEEYALNSTGLDNWWYVWNLANGELSTPSRNVFGPAIYDFAVEVDPEEEVINALSVERRGRNNLVVATTTNQLTILPFMAEITDVQLTTDMAGILSATDDGAVALWNVADGAQVAGWALDSAARRLHIAADNTTFTAVTGDGLYRLPLDAEALALYEAGADVLAGDVVETADGTRAALALADGTVVVVDVVADGGEVVATLADVPGVAAVALSASGALVAATQGDAVAVYAADARPPAPLVTLTPNDGALLHLAFSPEDIWLVTAGESGRVYVYSLPTN